MATTSISLLRYRRPATESSPTDRQAPKRDHLTRATTLFGWTPGIRYLITGRVLPCGCLVGVYQTTGGGSAGIIDARGPACPCEDHQPDVLLEGDAVPLLR